MKLFIQLVRTVAAAFSMFSAIPVPRFFFGGQAWNQRDLRYLLCAFPLVGAAIGLCWYGWGMVCEWLSLPSTLRGAGWTVLPVLLTGGVHLDGYADTIDALSSYAPPERRREILKDPHCGAFAVIWLCMYLIATFALCVSLKAESLIFAVPPYFGMIPAFILSRALSGAALTFLPLSAGGGLARTFVEAADRRRVLAILILETACAAFLLWKLLALTGLLMVLAAFAVLLRYIRTAKRAFGGVSGDLAGWFLQKAEFWMLAVLVLAQFAKARLT